VPELFNLGLIVVRQNVIYMIG